MSPLFIDVAEDVIHLIGVSVLLAVLLWMLLPRAAQTAESQCSGSYSADGRSWACSCSCGPGACPSIVQRCP